MRICYWILAAGSFLYYLALTIYTGFSNRFNLIWILISIFFAVLAVLRKMRKSGKLKINRFFFWSFYGMAFIGVLMLLFSMTLILKGKFSSSQPDADYVVVLGAGVKKDKPSLILKYRIERAAQYLLDNPESIAIVSGGKGRDEEISEALAMQRGLIEAGIESDRIIMEEESVSTEQNMEFSKNLMSDSKASVVIVTSDFHIYRALKLAKECGMTNVSGASARSVRWMIPANYLRECAAVWYYMIRG